MNAGIFASTWFITQFTSSLSIKDDLIKDVPPERLAQEDLISPNMLQLWDYFIASGWKSIFKMALYILRTNEERLL